MKRPLEITGCTYFRFMGWRRFGLLNTDYSAVSQGVRIDFTFANVLELAFMVALTNCGFTAMRASRFSMQLMSYWQEQKLPETICFNHRTGKILINAGEFTLGHCTRILVNDDETPASGISVVFPKLIYDRVTQSLATDGWK